MANNLIQIKRTSIPGRAANTTTLPNPGELAINMTDGILYSGNGSFIFEIGANNTNVNVSGNLTVKSVVANGSVGGSGTVLTSDGNSVYWGPGAAGYTGSKGDIGYTGSQGDTGFTGSAGTIGVDGYTGSKGDVGFTGSTGSTGFTGSAGAGINVGANNQIIYRDSSNNLTGSSNFIYDGSNLKVNGNLESLYQSGDEGGEIYLNKPATNTSITNGVTIDVYQNKLRIFEAGGTNRGAFIDITAAAAGVGSDLLAGGGGGTGYTGSQGDTGFTGSVGFTGSKGDVGFVGSKGDLGFTGSKGDIGFTGSIGDVGFVGSKGDTGFTGSVGFVGSEGIGTTGFTGSIGPIGYTGSPGTGGGGGASVSVSDTPPVSPTAGNLWWNSTTGVAYIYYNDGDSSQWVEFTPRSTSSLPTSSSTDSFVGMFLLGGM